MNASIINRLVDFLTWWLWRRWHIYCPNRSVAHLFPQNRRIVMTPYGEMEFPNQDEFEKSLFDYDEMFVSPCSLKYYWQDCGNRKWTPKMGLLSMDMPEEDK